ncbi:MAG TPA: RNA polymerase sigma factor [Longimicrobium sp.]
MALATVYRAHHTRIFGTLYRLLGDAAAAADVTHDAFVRAWESAAYFRGEAGLGTWITRIGINLALKQLRRERWMTGFQQDETAGPAAVRPVSLDALELDRAIRALPEALRSVLVLHAVEGYSHPEVAELLGISEAACRQRLHRARMRLAGTLAEED